MNTYNKPPTTNKPAPLGRGLSALFGDTDSSYAPTMPTYRPEPELMRISPGPAGTPPMKNGVMKMPLSMLQPGAFQPRRVFDEVALQGLADSIKERGILEPLLVRSIPGLKDSYEIVAGERRWRAAQIAKLHEVPAIVRELTDREALEFGLIENIQRQDLTPLEEAEGYQRLLNEFNHTQDVLSKILGKSRPHITNMLRLLTLPVDVKQMMNDGKLTFGHARALVGASNPSFYAKHVVEKHLSVRQTEAFVKDGDTNPQNFLKGKMGGKSADTVALEKEIEKITGLRVELKPRGMGGTLVLKYKNLDQLDDVVKRLRG
jgi:ParB family transcriptional regulator, chromosome partitioning protein